MSQYTSTIRDFPLMFLEMKRTAILLCEGKKADEILQLSVIENIYQLDKEKRRRSMPLKMTKRLSTIKEPLIKLLATGTPDEAKLVAFLALMKAERLIFEYMAEVYSDKIDFDELTNVEYLHFIDRKILNSNTVANWNSNTIKSLCSKIKQILCDAGLAKKNGNAIIVQRPLVDETFFSLLDNDDWVYAKTVLGDKKL